MVNKNRKTITVLAPSDAHIKIVRSEDLKKEAAQDIHVLVPEWGYQHLRVMFEFQIRQALIFHFGGQTSITSDWKDPDGIMGLLPYDHRVKAVVYVDLGYKVEIHEVTVWRERPFLRICIEGADRCTFVLTGI